MENQALKTIKAFVDNLNIKTDKHLTGETRFWIGKHGDILAIVDEFEGLSQCHITASGKRCLAEAQKRLAA